MASSPLSFNLNGIANHQYIFVVEFHRNIYAMKFMEFQFQTDVKIFPERTRNIKVDSVAMWKPSDFGNSFNLNAITDHQWACIEPQPLSVCSRNVLGTANRKPFDSHCVSDFENPIYSSPDCTPLEMHYRIIQI